MQIDQILVTNMAVFCYLIVDDKTNEAALIDPAGDFDLIEDRIKERGVHVKYVINTHGHWDHVSGNDHMTESTGAKLLIHENDFPKLEGKKPEDTGKFKEMESDPEKSIYFIEDEDIIMLGDLKLSVIHTPGHAPGAVCIYVDGHIFTGDTLFTEGHGRTDLPGGSEDELVKSISERILKLPDDTVILPGHHYGSKATSTVLEQKKLWRIV